MKAVLKIVKWLLILIVALVVMGFIAMKVLSEDRPNAIPNTNADQVANEMLTALNKPAWDSLRYLKWEFMAGHKYLWDKQNNNAVVSWGDNKVVMNLDEISGKAYDNGVLLPDNEAGGLIENAWSFWCNDSFWMFAPFKVFDPGTSRSIVETGDEHTGLMVTYESGGVTPGDSYLWLLDEQNIPTGYKMWTFIPLQGMYMSWENWKTLDGSAKVAISHKSSIMSFDMKDVQAGNTPSDLGYDNDVFAGI